MVSPEQHFAARWLGQLSRAIRAHRPWFIYPQLVLAVVCVLYTVKHLQFDTSRDNLVGGNKKYHRNFLKFKQEFPLQDDLVVVVESEDKEKNRQFVERLGHRVELETNLFTDVIYKGDLKMLGPKALLFIPEADLTELLQALRDYRPFLDRFAQATNLAGLFRLVNRQILQLVVGARADTNAASASPVKALPALNRILEQANDSLKRGGTPPAPGIDALFNAGSEAEDKMYITHAHGRIYLVTARPANGDVKAQAVARLRELVGLVQQEVSGLNVGVTGEPVLELDEMAQSERDTLIATVISFVLVFMIIIYGYGDVTRRIKADFCLFIGMAYTMAFTTVTVGHLNILTITFAPILIGLAIDFGVHLIARYEEELGRGASVPEALDKAMIFTGQGVFTGALTTAGAFLAMSATNFRGIQEMGVICGGGLVVCLLPMMTLLPALLTTRREARADSVARSRSDRRERIERLWLSRPRFVIIATVGLCAAALIPLPKVFFDYDLLNMQSKGLPAVIFEKKLINTANRSVLFGAIVADSLPHALQLEAKLTNLPAVASADLGGIDGLNRYLTEDQTRKLEFVREIKMEVTDVHFGMPDQNPVDLKDLSTTLWSLYGYMALAISQVPPEETNLVQQIEALRRTISDFRFQTTVGDTEAIRRKLGAFQTALFKDVRDTFQTLQHQDASSRLTVNDLPAALRQRVVGVTGKYLVQAYPKKDVWQRENQREFVRELRQVDPNVTGTPVQLYEYTTLLKNSYLEAAGYSLIAVAFLVLLHFRSLGCVVLSLVPVGVGLLWMVGWMGLMEIPFNPANIMTLPLVIGVGVTNGIHILNRFSEEHTPSILARSTGKAVVVSALTTISGFGSLILAKHQGIASLGLIMAVGTATCMIAGLTFLPALLNVLSQRGSRITKPSGDNARSPAGSGGTEAKASGAIEG